MTDISEEHSYLLLEVSEAVGRRFARQYPSQRAEEIAGEVTAQALAKWEIFQNKLSRAHEYERTEREVLAFLLSQRAEEYCGKQHYAYQLENADAAVYTPREVRALLKEIYYAPHLWTTPGKDKQHGTAVDTRSVWCNLADLKAALTRVSPKAHDAILAAYGPEDLNLPAPDKRRLSEAVAELTRQLNKHLWTAPQDHDGPGARRAMSNAAAINHTRQQEY